MSRFVDADALQYKIVWLVDPETGKMRTDTVVFAREIDKAPTVEIFKKPKKTYMFFDEYVEDTK